MTARATVAAMTAYTLELHEAEVKLNQNESPFDYPFKAEALERVAARPWNIYPDFESTTLRAALADAYGYEPGNIYYIPVLTRAVYDGVTVGETITYLGQTAEVVSKLATFGAQPVGGAPEVLAKTNATEYQVMGKLIKDLAITAD